MTPEEAERELKARLTWWEPWKALAAMIAASAVFLGGVLAVGAWIHPSPQVITVRLDGGPITIRQVP